MMRWQRQHCPTPCCWRDLGQVLLRLHVVVQEVVVVVLRAWWNNARWFGWNGDERRVQEWRRGNESVAVGGKDKRSRASRCVGMPGVQVGERWFRV